MAAITEEFIFRSYLLTFTNLFFPCIISIIINALLFYAIHLNSKIIQLVFMASAFCLITIYTNNILPAIVAHWINNIISTIYRNHKLKIEQQIK